MKQYKVKINRNEALRYLGFHGNNADKAVIRQLEEASSLLGRISAPAYTYRICKIVRNPKGISEGAASNAPAERIFLEGTSIVLTGTSAISFLKECHSCIMMAVTIGRRVDQELYKRQISDIAGAVILDSCASNAVESICEQLQNDLGDHFLRKNMYLTDRFSPGYGDLPLSLQPEICRALSTEKRIGLSVTGSMLMLPVKSVTAFIGISDHPQPAKLTGCSRCRLNASCNYRKAGITCAD